MKAKPYARILIGGLAVVLFPLTSGAQDLDPAKMEKFITYPGKEEHKLMEVTYEKQKEAATGAAIGAGVGAIIGGQVGEKKKQGLIGPGIGEKKKEK